MKVVSVLIYPFQNKLMVRVTRATGYFDYPHITREYSISYTSPRFNSFFHWVCELERLNLTKIVKTNRGY